MLKKISFIVALIGIAFLMFLLAKPSLEVQNMEEAKINQKIIIEGVVKSEKEMSNFKILSINNTEVLCSCSQTYLNKKVQVIGLVEEYKGKKQVRVLEIRALS